jgi:predicted helicase
LRESFKKSRIIKYDYRPYVSSLLYHSNVFIDEHGLTSNIFCDNNIAFCISGNGSSKPFQILGVNTYSSLDLLEKTQCLPLYRYDKNGDRIENITDWGLEQFVNRYNDDTITKQDIFHYVYAVLHNPAYRKKYELNLKREFPRIPYYDDFRQWADWGEQLMNLHINYETAEPYPLRIADLHVTPDTGERARPPKTKLKAEKSAGIIILDDQTELHGIPAEVWEYKLGSRSALEWILDQYQERKPKDPTIAENFDTYRFADYKEQVIDLLKRVCAVSLQTTQITKQMESEL